MGFEHRVSCLAAPPLQCFLGGYRPRSRTDRKAGERRPNPLSHSSLTMSFFSLRQSYKRIYNVGIRPSEDRFLIDLMVLNYLHFSVLLLGRFALSCCETPLGYSMISGWGGKETFIGVSHSGSTGAGGEREGSGHRKLYWQKCEHEVN